MNREIITALFFGLSQSEKACIALFEKGYKSSDVNLIIAADTWKKYFQASIANSQNSEVSLDELKAVLSIRDVIKLAKILPGLDVLVAGPIGLHIGTSGPQGTAAGIVGLFQRCGMPNTLSSQYEQEVMGGGIMLGVQPQFKTEVEPIANIWRQHQGTHIHHCQDYPSFEA